MSIPTYLSLGSNLGARRDNLRRALRALERAGAVRVTALSPVYETAPWGKTDQPPFLNICLAGRTPLEPAELLRAAQEVEAGLGRERHERWGPRTIDVDILFYGDVVRDEDDLTLPHPRLAERAFVLAPLADIAPSLAHPRSGATVAQMWAALPAEEKEAVRRMPRPLEWGRRTQVMGILNVTPDSFSGDGILQEEAWLEAAVAQARQFVADGADIVDVGGESTRQGSAPVTEEEEMARVVPAVAALRRAIRVPISVDTYRAPVAAAALEAGADWINDVWALRMDPGMAPLVAAAGCPVVLMHNRSPRDEAQAARLGDAPTGANYGDLLAEVKAELQSAVDGALAQGIAPEQILLDPGIGFGKTVTHNVRLIDELDCLRAMGYPILIGTSRKSFIGHTLDLPPDERVEGTAATVAIAIDRGADVVRVHDVRAMARVARMTDRIVRHSGAPTQT